MAIAHIQEGIIVNIEPFVDDPIDYSWVYVTQAKVNFDQKYYTLSDPSYEYDSNTHTVQEIITPIPKPLEYVLELKLSELAAFRYDKQNSGTTFNGVPVDTGEVSQSKILGIRLQALIDPAYTVNFKTIAGFFTLDSTAINALSDAVREHIQLCFDNEAAHITAIQALTDAQEVIEYDITTGWPS